MSGLSQFLPLLGAPTRTTRYHAGTVTTGTHTWVPGARWCRVTVVGGGGKGGNTGNWNNGFGLITYEQGGGGGGGETRVVEFDPSHVGAVPFAVGAGSSPSVFHSIVARAGANGLTGGFESGGFGYAYEGGLGGGLQRFGDNDDDAEKPTAPDGSYCFPGRSGQPKGTGHGGDSLFGKGGTAGAPQSDPWPAAINNGAAGSGFGAGGGAGGAAGQTTSNVRTGGTGADGTGGLIVVEEWVY